jgi:hypothetical protein
LHDNVETHDYASHSKPDKNVVQTQCIASHNNQTANGNEPDNQKLLQNSVNFDFQVYPNPSAGTFSVIPTVAQDYVITISDATGTIVYVEELTKTTEKTFNLRTAGEYNVRLQAGKYESIHKLIIIK